MRSGIIADSSARKQAQQPARERDEDDHGIDAAPSSVTITGAIPVTRIVPARPITNAPHQLVVLREPAARVVELVVAAQTCSPSSFRPHNR